MKQAMLIVNPSSGKEEALDHVETIKEILTEKGYEVSVAQTEKELDATKYCQGACKDEFDLIVSMGGDGTLHETINGMVDQTHRPLLGIIPLGTVNDFARALDIPLQVEEAVDVLRSDQTKAVDIGRFNDQYFVNIVAAGAVAEATSEVTPEQKTKFGSLAYMMEGMKTLTNHSYPIRIEYDDKAWEGESFLFLAALTNSAGGFENLSPEAEVNDGKIHGYVVPKVSMIRLATIASAIVRGNLKDEKDVQYFKADRIRLTSKEELVTNVDGEEGDPLPVELSVLPSHIQVVVK
ncbi:lipid kinase, YegS/Rv2252/BmrU family [Halobacillus karajensis]|uniref:diacylglycerol/lipid kinase family protein n=1 Tax=Halobacillus karajensis TaxID=195088 RepID=UPI0008A7AE43|nr:YegS/Rv2252/BmrU family lipid kinase [Halobacillus karajensis]SEI09130.1 lipid kinase, YegS/Rv2252/BmrU family [Halobacillus karajensis]